MLLCNFDINSGLCNGTTLQIYSINQNKIWPKKRSDFRAPCHASITVFGTDRNRKCCQLYFLFFRFCEGSVFARACSSDLSLSVKFSVDFKAEVQEHLLHPLLSLHQIQVDGAWLHYQGYLRRRSCRLHY